MAALVGKRARPIFVDGTAYLSLPQGRPTYPQACTLEVVHVDTPGTTHVVTIA